MKFGTFVKPVVDAVDGTYGETGIVVSTNACPDYPIEVDFGLHLGSHCFTEEELEISRDY